MYVCEICGFEESSQSSMEAHIERTHTCAECQTMFKDVYELNRHRENFHSREFKCNSCAFKSKSEQDYKTHLQTHEGPKYSCDLCGKQESREIDAK